MINIGDIIRDIEDGDFFYEGIVVEINPIKYKITDILCGEEHDLSMNGQITELVWWKLSVFRDNKWIEIY